MKYATWRFVSALAFLLPLVLEAKNPTLYLIKAMAANSAERTRIANTGVAIDGILSDSVTFMATPRQIAKLKKAHISFEVNTLTDREENFPAADSAYHTYAQTQKELAALRSTFPHLVQTFSLGKSLEGRDLTGIRLSSHSQFDSLPTAIFLGCHHAREHLSVEIPLKLARYLAENYATNARVKDLLDHREVYVVPMVNPDGAEFDIATGNYVYWRKNRRNNGDGTQGIDLNRNYSKFFAGEGASPESSDDTYHGPSSFSEPETQAVRDFLRARKHAATLITFHTFSELILWPWSGSSETLSNDQDRKVFETMGKQMAQWNHYQPEKSSDLYVAAGDTTDWAYDELKIFAFTFEMSPTSMMQGGFYPGARAIQPTFDANLQPALYLIQHAGNPYEVLNTKSDPLHILRE